MSKRDLGLAAVLLVAALLLIFPSLDNRYLWDDEAETALLARNVLRFGVPVAWDGVSLISQECGADYDVNYLWRQTPWLPVYLTAASFALLDVSTLAARLPFALLGLLSLPSIYLVARLRFRSNLVAFLASASLLLSVPFLLHIRQDRYYAVAILAAVWVLYCFFALLERRRGAAVGLAVALTVMLHANYLLFFGTVAGLALGFLGVVFDRAAAPRLAAAVVASVAVNLPWLTVFDLGGKTALMASFASLGSFASNLATYLLRIELYAFPALLLVTVGLACAIRRRARPDLGSPDARACLFLLLFAIGHLLVISLVPYVFFRFQITLLPVYALLQAFAVSRIAQRSRALAAAILLLALLPDRADLAKGSFGVTLAKYVDEITHDVDGPIEAIVRHLQTSARPGDRVFISYGDLPLRFYTDLEVRGGQGCQSLAGWPPPDWIIVRYFFRFRPSGPGAQEDMQRTLRYLNSDVPPHLYRRIDLPQVDTIWENIPEPHWHVYRTPDNRPRITIHEKLRAPVSR